MSAVCSVFQSPGRTLVHLVLPARSPLTSGQGRSPRAGLNGNGKRAVLSNLLYLLLFSEECLLPVPLFIYRRIGFNVDVRRDVSL